MNTQMIDNEDQKLSPQMPTEVPNEIVETQTKKIPNLTFMALAGVAVASSIYLAVRAGTKTDMANFIGQWVPTFLIFGVYNKIVKLEPNY